jgi:hypothetical protein
MLAHADMLTHAGSRQLPAEQAPDPFEATHFIEASQMCIVCEDSEHTMCVGSGKDVEPVSRIVLVVSMHDPQRPHLPEQRTMSTETGTVSAALTLPLMALSRLTP